MGYRGEDGRGEGGQGEVQKESVGEEQDAGSASDDGSDMHEHWDHRSALHEDTVWDTATSSWWNKEVSRGCLYF
eukprot:CAMPEP_0119489698 /NCGR_PEP_ID=MMETSP1344-20130328/15078_1 /TAXON_ID=236787 /ORGANISM="Florenciella parvula, Strain CCMP2471" /LENGTH=73 /DNA_ID=CAMNT_0007524773 /DNA_START=594 /DNA_END=815 /DNA_ORIENTATION=-